MIRRIINQLRALGRKSATPDVEHWQAEIIERVLPFTMAGPERILSTINAVEYVVRAGVEGAIVECGVWKGGNMMAAALALQHLNTQRLLYLFDTFAGMTTPQPMDKDFTGTAAQATYARFRRKQAKGQWCEAGIEEVQANMALTQYASGLIRYVEGPVESTLPSAAPPQIAILRLDTDWYASTLHELIHLYPRIRSGGVVIIDDYGHWRGARQAVDEYLKEQEIRCLLHRIDYSGREFVKP
jgi:O-methyltransferase